MSLMQGKISDIDIQRIAKELGENFTYQEIQEMVQEADRNGWLSSLRKNFLFVIFISN